jgi:hypothetical protein
MMIRIVILLFTGIFATAGVSRALTFTEWRLQEFPPADAANDTVSGPNADPDKDGVQNFVEFGVDSNPLARDTQLHPQTAVDAYGHLTLSFTRRKIHAGYVYLPVVSSRMEGPWQFGVPWVEEMSVINRDAETETVIVRDPKTMTDLRNRFIRLIIADDADNDGLPDVWEIANGLNPSLASDATADDDGDGIPNWLEIAFGLDPHNPDDASFNPDADAFSTGEELDHGLDPLEANTAFWDTDGDGIPDFDEVLGGTDPVDPFDGQAPVITTYGGDGQIAWANAYLAESIDLRIANANGRPISDLAVFITVDGGGFATSNSSPSTVVEGYMQTDADGFLTVWVKHGSNFNTDCHATISFGNGPSATQLIYTSRILGDPSGVGAPQNMQSVWSETGQLTLSWADASSNETEFAIERSIGDEAHYLPIGRIGANVAQWVVPNPLTSPNVYYRANSTH